jgi:signal transduction histidine kinase
MAERPFYAEAPELERPLRPIGNSATTPAVDPPATGLTLLTVRALLPDRLVRAHAVRNCLTLIEAVHAVVEAELCEQSRQKLARSRAALRRAHALVLEEAALAPDASPPAGTRFCSAEQIVSAAIERVQDRAQASGLELCVRCGLGGVEADEAALVLALENVLVNALAAADGWGAVRVTTSELSGGVQYWTVDDTGRGMAPDVLGRIGTPRAPFAGGLEVARQIVEAHGGLVRVESEPGVGTRVSFWLPAGR